MVDDLLSSDGISKEYLVILKQIEDYCSRGPEIDLDFQTSTNGNVSHFESILYSTADIEDVTSYVILQTRPDQTRQTQFNLHFINYILYYLAKRPDKFKILLSHNLISVSEIMQLMFVFTDASTGITLYNVIFLCGCSLSVSVFLCKIFIISAFCVIHIWCFGLALWSFSKHFDPLFFFEK